jgi:hypothetical protein
MVIRGIIGEMGAVRARIGAETRARQVAGVVSPTGVIRQRKPKIGGSPRGGEVGELVFIECDLHHADASKRRV